MTRSIAEIEAELAAARAAEAAKKAETAAAVPPVFEYTVTPCEQKDYIHREVFDDTVALWKITGRCVNREQSAEAGNRMIPNDGGMVYAYNTVTKKIIMAVGGGTIFIGSGFRGDSTEARRAMDEVSAYIAANPDGGVITHIVNHHKANRGL